MKTSLLFLKAASRPTFLFLWVALALLLGLNKILIAYKKKKVPETVSSKIVFDFSLYLTFENV